jgi:hypothetical protein
MLCRYFCEILPVLLQNIDLVTRDNIIIAILVYIASIDHCYLSAIFSPSEDYGFLDSSDAAYDMVAQQLLGKRRIAEGVGAGRLMSEPDQQNTMDQLKQTTVEEDRNLLKGETNPSLVAAYNYRIGVKNSLSKYGGGGGI